jgi:hypothetical protein
MIIGRGVVASIIKDNPEYIYFACGFSNREKLTENIKNSEREKILKHDGEIVFYFNSNYYYEKIKYE